MMIPLKWLRYLLAFEVNGPLLWLGRDRGAQFKGLLADAMRKQFECEPTHPCSSCQKAFDEKKCDFALIFNPQIYGALKTPSWVLLPPLNGRSVFKKGERIFAEVRLLGELASHDLFLRRFLPAMEIGMMFEGIGNWHEKGVRGYGTLNLCSVDVWKSGKWQRVYTGGTMVEEKEFLPVRGFSSTCQMKSGTWEVDFITPVSLNKKGTSIESPSFLDVVEASFRRISSLLPEEEKGGETIKELEKIVEIASRVETIQSSFSRCEFRSKKMVIDGYKKDRNYIIGSLVVKDIPVEIFPLLYAGGIAHIGKGVSQGYGGFVLRGIA